MRKEVNNSGCDRALCAVRAFAERISSAPTQGVSYPEDIHCKRNPDTGAIIHKYRYSIEYQNPIRIGVSCIQGDGKPCDRECSIILHDD